jgi:Ser/Thr protein kinase RdoA (MazF antagonist)
MSNMHSALAHADLSLPSTVAGEYQAIFGRMQRYFNDAQVSSALHQKLNLRLVATDLSYYLALLEKLTTLPGQQPLHMDFVRGNILFTGSKEKTRLCGILDFEKTATGHPLCDIARTLAFLLVDCHLPESKIRKYFLYSGYTKRGQAVFRNLILKNARHTTMLEALVDLFLLHDFYKFLRHNPYEFLLQNHHFRRTQELLLKRAVIVRTNDKI